MLGDSSEPVLFNLAQSGNGASPAVDPDSFPLATSTASSKRLMDAIGNEVKCSAATHVNDLRP